MLNKFLQIINRYNMLNKGEKVLIGVSGGADSMCLLQLFLEAKETLGVSITVAHVNHMLRGEEADRDEAFVKEFCKSNKIEFYSAKINIPEIAERTGKSTELTAREERYRFFDSITHDKLATAHTKTDRVETMLMNLSRGSGLHGLTSIPSIRGKVIRPLLDFSREETESYCHSHNINYVTDSTNLIADCTRNKFRLNIIPEIEKTVPAFEDNATRCIESLIEDDSFFYETVTTLFNECYSEGDKSFYIVKIISLHPSIKKRLIIRYLMTISVCDYERRHIDFICERLGNSFALTLPGDITIIGDETKLTRRNKQNIPCMSEQITLSRNEITEFIFNNTEYTCFNVNKAEYIPENNDIITDYSTIADTITVRCRQTGDSITLPKRKCTKTLKKYFNELKLPEYERNAVAVFEDKNGIIAIAPLTENARCSAYKSDQYFIIRNRRIKK